MRVEASYRLQHCKYIMMLRQQRRLSEDDGGSPPVGKLLLNCDSELGLESPHTSVGTTVIDNERINDCLR